jgi:hypothetical protein
VSCGETNGGGAVSWPFVPYPPQLHWQVRKQHQPGSRSPPPLPPFVASFSVFVLGGAPCLAECSAVFFLFFLFRFFSVSVLFWNHAAAADCLQNDSWW